MQMRDRMEQFLKDALGIHEKDLLETIMRIATIKHYTKGQPIYSQGAEVGFCSFLMEGVAGAFVYTQAGKQIADNFATRMGEMITPLMDQQKKALTSVFAMTTAEVFVIANHDVESLFRAYPSFHSFLFSWLLDSYCKQWELKNARYQMTARGRYIFLLERYRGLDGVVSDKHLASFLDMSPETFSREKRSLRERKPD